MFDVNLVELAKKMTSDRKDRPVFIYALILRRENPFTYLVTGDKALRNAVNDVEEGLAITVDEALELIEGVTAKRLKSRFLLTSCKNTKQSLPAPPHSAPCLNR